MYNIPLHYLLPVLLVLVVWLLHSLFPITSINNLAALARLVLALVVWVALQCIAVLLMRLTHCLSHLRPLLAPLWCLSHSMKLH